MTSVGPGQASVAPLLVLAVGNPSRGDDALGPLFIERVGEALRSEIDAGRLELLTDFQLQVEHALDLAHRQEVVFVDASVSVSPPFSFAPVTAARDQSATSHAMSPSAVLATMAAIGQRAPPRARVLAIRGERFELGDGLSEAANRHLDAAVRFFVREVREPVAPERATVRPVRIEIEGTVQGVGFRPWVLRVAGALGLRGRVFNTPRGVTIEASGGAESLAALARALREDTPAAARVRTVRETDLDGPAADAIMARGGFVIATSEQGGAALLTVPADLALCAACEADLGRPTDRHHGYAFTSCAACGPRFSILEALPFDRAHTSMAPFVLCPDCAREYGDLGDRRLHAQAIACPACGPRLWLATPSGIAVDEGDPLDAVARRLERGDIVGVQGLGGFHLACDATSASAVAELRRRKRRDAKPFAVMVADLAAAEALAELDDEARRVLTSTSRPIVLAPLRSPAVGSLAAGVVGDSRRVGVFLPYMPLHHILLRRLARPLVMTSGNLGGEPIAVTHDDATRTLSGIVDALLLHDRPIVRRVEDSVVASERGVSRVIRRARGLSPEPIRLPLAAAEPVLAVGGHLKNTACLVVGDQAYLTPHLGDLESHAAELAFRRDLESFERLLGVRADVLVHDLHPDYAATRYARERPARVRIGVQHHVAHVLATAAELGLDEPLLGVVFDGTGYGTDGTAWGAELLVVDGTSWRRPCSFRALPLAGGDRAVREAWRTAYGALREAFGAEASYVAQRLPLFADLPAGTVASIDHMITTGVGTVGARGMGRWFDAFGALFLSMPRASFEGQVAVAWEDVADAGSARAYPYGRPLAAGTSVDVGEAAEIDLRPTVRAAVADHLDGVSAGVISARFHQTIIEATTDTIEGLGLAAGVRRVVLSGGSFQNRRLERGFVAALGRDRVALAREVPVNDGGLALGQAYAGVLALARAT